MSWNTFVENFRHVAIETIEVTVTRNQGLVFGSVCQIEWETYSGRFSPDPELQLGRRTLEDFARSCQLDCTSSNETPPPLAARVNFAI